MDKPKFIPVTDPKEADELADNSDLSKPYTVKPNGHLWAEPDQYHAWRAGREDSPDR